MTAIKAPASSASSRRKRGFDPVGSDSSKARLFLGLAVVWPLILLSILSSSSTNGGPRPHFNASAIADKPALRFRKYLDRVDIVGYGPTHPRVAVVIVADDAQDVVSSVESVFENTDMNRLFLVCVVMDGVESDQKLVNKMHEIEQGSVHHWHGLTPDVHQPGDNSTVHDTEDEVHGKKIVVLFNKDKQGVGASRTDAVDFVSLLSKKYEQRGLKSDEEDLILLLLQSGAKLTSHKWLAPVTTALIVPPPLMGVEDTSLALKMANAISFGIEGDNEDKAVEFDYTFKTRFVEPSAKEMAASNGDSFPSGALAGGATALRLQTYRQLPSQDADLQLEEEANLDLALNLWLCADGIDVLKDVTVSTSQTLVGSSIKIATAAGLAASWMEEEDTAAVFAALKRDQDMSQSTWENLMRISESSPDFTPNLQTRCRDFSWYANEVNDALVPPEEEKAEPKHDSHSKHPVTKQEKNAQKEEKKEEKVEKEEKFEIPPEQVREDADAGKLPPPPAGNSKRKPLIPIRQTNLDILKTADPIDVAYVDMTDGHKDHPHKGAVDTNGNPGFIHDETALRKNPPTFDFPNLKVACERKDGHSRVLTEKVKIDMDKYDAKPDHTKLFCIAYTISPFHDRLNAIMQTWGPKCDGFMVASNQTDPTVHAVDILHEGPEEYNNIYQKVRSIWSYVYDNYYDQYDWFHIGGDDLYVLVENLKMYLESDEILTAQNGGVYLPNGDETEQTPLFLGRRFAYQGDMDDIFNSGGSGYTLNKAALKYLVVRGFPTTMPHAHTFSEDTMVARVLKKQGIFPYDTKDDAGGERYMPFMPGHHLGYVMPDDPSKDWYARYSIDIKMGFDHFAEQSVAFHYAKDNMMWRMHAILYGKCP